MQWGNRTGSQFSSNDLNYIKNSLFQKQQNWQFQQTRYLRVPLTIKFIFTDQTLILLQIYFSIYSLQILYNRMAYRQRNIPVTSKEESQCQTDIRLLETYLFDEQNVNQASRHRDSTIKLSEIYGHSKLLRPFSDHHLLHEFARQVKELRNLPFDEKTFAKRLEILQAQINGLLKRDFLVHESCQGDEKWNSYYSTLNQKQKEIILLTREKIYTDLKIVHMQQRIDSLQEETTQLRKALVHSQKAMEENKVFSTFFEQLSQIIQSSNQKGRDIELAFQQQVLPLYSEVNINIVNINRIINKDVPVNIRPFAVNLAKEFDRLLKQHQMTEERLTDLIGSLINNFKAAKGVEHLKKQFDLAQRAEIAQNNYKSMLALFKHQIDSLKQDQPYLKGSEKLDLLLRKLEEENLMLVEINGWMNLAVSHIKLRESHKQETKLRQFVGIIAGEFKRLYQKFPEIKKHVSQQMTEIIYSQALVELIEGASIEKLKQIIIHEVDVVRVDNVFQYQNSKDYKLVLHLRVLVKYLFDQLIKLKTKHNLSFEFEEGIQGLLKELALDFIDTQKIIELFRAPARYIEVPVVVQNLVYETKTFQRGIPINRPEHIVLSEEKLQVVPINKQVPVFIQKPVEYVINKIVPVEITTQKAVEVTVNRDVIIDRVCQTAIEVPAIRQKVVPAYQREQVIKQIPVDRVVKDLEVRECQKIVELKIQEIVEVQKLVQKAVVCHQFKETVQEVQVKVPYIIAKTQLKEVEKRVPYIIESQKEVEVRVEVPVEIKKQEIAFVDVLQFRDRPIVLTNTIEKPVYTELKVEKEIIRQVPKQVFIQRSHFIKGDKEESIRQVEVFVDKPIIQQVLVTKDVQVQKIVPLYITEQVPVINQVYVPCVSQKVKEIEVQKIKVVPAKQEVVKPIHVDKPVPIIIEKEVVKIQQQFIDRIVEKIVEVPRVVEVEKIVEKIVVVPRIVEKIVQVPKIVEKIVIVNEPVLQIVEIPVPQIVIQEVEVPIQIFVDRQIIVKQKEIETVEVQKIVERTVTQQKCVQVEVQRRIPVQIIKQVPVQTYRDRIQYQKVFIHQTKVQSIEVQVPFIVQEKVPFVVEKEVIIHDVIQEPVYEKIYQEKQKPVIVKEQKLVIKEITVQRPIIQRQCIEIPGPETIIKLDQPYEVEVIREKLVRENHYKENIKQVVLQTEKIVPLIHEKIISVPVNEIVTTPELIQVPKIVELVHYKEISVDVPVRQERLQTTIVQQIKEVQKRVEVPHQVEISVEKIKEIANQIKCFIVQEREKVITKEVEVLVPTETKVIQVPSTPIIQELRDNEKHIEVEDRVYERLVQKIVMLPQIVEVVKHIHHISQVNQLGVAVDVDLNVHVEKYLGVTTQLRKGLVQLLSLFRSNVGRKPDLKNLIVIIEKYLKYIDDWIAFPKLVQIEKEVNIEVQKKKVVVVEKENKEKQASLGFIVEKLLNELKRIKDSHKISLALDEDILRIFFTERRGDDELDKKYEQFQQTLKKKYASFSEWSTSQPFLVTSFLQEHFALQNLVDEANRIQHTQQEQITLLKKELEISASKSQDLVCYNKRLFDENSALIRILQKYKNIIEHEDYYHHIHSHQQFYDEILEGKSRILISTIERNNDYSQSIIIEGNQGGSAIQKDSYIGELVSKITRHETESQSLVAKTKRLQSQITKYTEELNVKNSIIKRLQTDFESKLSRAKEELSKNPNLSKEITEENRKLIEKNKALERQFNTEKQNLEKAKRELERALESSKRDAARQAQRRERQIKELTQKNKRELDRQVTRLKADFERIRKEKERVDQELAELKRKSSQQIKSIREQQLSGATDKYNQLINQNLELRKRSDLLNAEYEKLKKAAADNNSINEKEMNKLKAEVDKLNIEKREWERQKKVGFMDLPQQTQLVNRNIELEKKIKTLQAQISKKGKDEAYLSEIKSLRENVKTLEIQLQTTKKELQAYQKMRSTAYQSGYKSGTYSGSGEYVVESSLIKSPKGGIFKSAEQKGFVSPQSVQSREERIEQLGSSSSRFSQESSEEKSFSNYKPQMLLRQFMDTKHGDQKEKDLYIIFVMIKVIEEVEKEIQKGNYYSYTPNNINILNFNPKQLDKLTIKFGVHIINRNKDNGGLYLAPQILSGQQASIKSVVFNLGIILDELIHGSTFFRSMQEIQNMQIQFKVRGDKLNPILKNTLFEMMNKQAHKRLELVEVKRRLSLQKYITSEGRSTVTITTRRYERRREE